MPRPQAHRYEAGTGHPRSGHPQDQVTDLAAAIAYWAFFSIFPLLLGLMALAGFSLDEAEVQSRIFQLMTDLLPGSADFIQQNLVSVVRYRSSMGAVGILGVLWTASKGLAAVTRAVNRALGAKKTRSYVASKLRFFGMTVAVAVLAVVSISVTVALEVVLNSSLLASLGLDEAQIPRLHGRLASFTFVFIMVSLIYKMTPYVKIRWRQILPGALLTSLLFELSKTGFIIYLDWMTRWQAIYGSLTSILVLLLWLYLGALILIFGVEYNFVRFSLRCRPAHQKNRAAPGDLP